MTIGAPSSSLSVVASRAVALTHGTDGQITTRLKNRKSLGVWGRLSGGGREIRTLGTLTRSTVFETAPFNHSGTPPPIVRYLRRYQRQARKTCERRGSTARAHLPATRCGREIFAPQSPVWTVDTGGWRRIVRPHSMDRRRNSRSALFLQEHLAFSAPLVLGRDR